MTNEPVLKQIFIDALRSPFLKEFGRRVPTIYFECASRSINDDLVHEDLKRYYFGQSRYTLIQSLLLNVANECGEQYKVEYCQRNGYPIPTVILGRFTLTVHHAFEIGEPYLINSSLIRKQHSLINHEYVQPNLFESVFDDSKLRNAKNIYVNLLYGCRGGSVDFASHGYMHFAFPYLKIVKGQERVHFAETFNYSEILENVVAKENMAAQRKTMVNIATPKIKIKQG